MKHVDLAEVDKGAKFPFNSFEDETYLSLYSSCLLNLAFNSFEDETDSFEIDNGYKYILSIPLRMKREEFLAKHPIVYFILSIPLRMKLL